MHRFLTPGAFGMTAFIPMCPQNYQHSSSPPQGQMNRQRRNFNGQQQQHNGRNRPYRPHALEESDRDKAECATVDSEKTVQAENEDAGDSGTKEEQ
ncbi:hypothetical protein L596_029703 [Steinernema carpocapsae]|uniref:Uncharacterized protein n=1 Tax=Steinernema carpocapsae TaxID=34508 RepID=A0A4U5LQK6_STECR|nr:hypothetical protein L596_029703 [Steinernema carpocapsae]